MKRNAIIYYIIYITRTIIVLDMLKMAIKCVEE